MRKTLLGLAWIFLLLANPSVTHAEQQLPAGKEGMVAFCDTFEQAELVFELWSRKFNQGESLDIVNEQVKDPTACIAAHVRYYEGQELDRLDSYEKVQWAALEYRVVRILVVAVQNRSHVMEDVQWKVFFGIQVIRLNAT